MLTTSNLGSIDVLGTNFIFSLEGHQYIFYLPLGLYPELIQRHRRDKTILLFVVLIQILLLQRLHYSEFIPISESIETDIFKIIVPQVDICLIYGIDFGVKVIQILYKLPTGKSNRKGIHCMVPMIISLGPILNYRNRPAVTVLSERRKTELLIFIPVQFPHHIHQLPVFTKSCRHRAGCRNHELNHGLKNFPGLSGNILTVAKFPVDKIFRDVLGLHKEPRNLGFGHTRQPFHPVYIGLHPR